MNVECGKIGGSSDWEQFSEFMFGPTTQLSNRLQLTIPSAKRCLSDQEKVRMVVV